MMTRDDYISLAFTAALLLVPVAAVFVHQCLAK